MNRIRILALVAMLAMIFGFANVSPATAQVGTIFYVKQAATGSGDGLSWANATTLQGALGSAASGDEIWVAKGLYKPTGGTDRTISFNLVPGVAVYGGFDPDNGADTFGERDWVANPTVLSGDIDNNDTNQDPNGVIASTTDIVGANSRHVVFADGATGPTITSTTILDGFIITAGYADGGTQEAASGGGFYCLGAGAGNDCSPSLSNIRFSASDAYLFGGAMFNDGGQGGSSSPTLSNVTFYHSRSSSDGGGMYNNGYDGGSSSPILTNVTFDGNVSGHGGAMYNNGAIEFFVFTGASNGSSSPILNQVTFINNMVSGTGRGGAMYNNGSSDGSVAISGGSSPILTDVTFTGNISEYGEGGAMYNDGSNSGTSIPMLSGVSFTGNTAYTSGGAIYNYGYYLGNSSPILVDVTFTGNSVRTAGGAIYNDGNTFGNSSPVLTDVTFISNTASNSSSSAGGAIYNNAYFQGESSPTLNGVTFISNSTSGDGGAIYNNTTNTGTTDPSLTNVMFFDNSANRGGAIFSFGGNSGHVNLSLTNLTFSGNTATSNGGAIYTLGYNANPSWIQAILTNVILWGDTSGGAAEIYNLDAELTASYSVVEGGVGGITNLGGGSVTDGGNNLAADPLFVNQAGGDLQLPSGSPAVDAGDDAACPATDLLGATRPQGAHCDIGAYEYTPPSFTVTFNANGGSGTMASQSSNIPANLTSNTFTRTDYYFIGWNTAADGTGTAYADGASYNFSADLDLFAQWSFSADFVITVKTDNLLSGSSTSTQFKIPTTGLGYNYNVDCNNDGTDEVTGYTSSTGYTCDYGPTGLNTGAGTYTIRIRPNQDILGRRTGFPRIFFEYRGERLKLLDVQQWGTGKWRSMSYAFSGCDNLGTFTATDSPDLSLVTDMSFMFTATRNFSADLSSWDTSNVTNMAYMFQDADFNGDIGSWNTGNVTSMYNMFDYATKFNQDISGWNTGNVTRMDYMFFHATAFDQNLGAWNVAKVTNATGMFQGKALSTANYDALLIGWDAQTLTPNVPFHGGNSKYCAGEAARANMISSDGWNITDLGKATCFTVTFDANGGTGTMSPQTSDVAANLTSNTFTRTGYTFTGWNTAADGSGTSYADTASYPFTADAILYAQWSSNTSIYTVTFNANGGTGTMTPQTSSVAANLTANAFTRTGYTFTGWNTAANGSGTSYADSASYPFTADATLYAQWSINTYTVTFDANGGTGTMSNQTGNYNVAANLTANAFTRTGYTFTGWNTAADGSGTAYADGDSYPFTADATLYAQWSNTLVGSNVEVQPVDTTSGTEAPVTLTFDQITQAGTTSLTTSSTGTPPPAGFQLGNPPLYYDLSTTALFAGQVEVCIDYTGTSFTNEASLQLHHYENGAWVDRTISLDTTNNIICASVTSFSEFGTFEKVNEPPVADVDSYSTDEDTLLDVAAPGVLGNDTDADNDPLTAVLDTDASNGSLTLNSDGSFTYTPNADFCGPDSFTYHANDGTVDSIIAKVDIGVVCVDDPPVVSVDMTTQSVQYSDRIADVTVTATDTDSASLNTSGSLPDNLSLSGGCTPSGAGSTCSWTLAGPVLVSADTYDIALTVSDATTGVTANTQVVVTPEDADVSFDSDNPVAVRVAQDGGNSGPFSLTFYVRETQPDQPTNSSAAGKLSPDDVSMSLSMSLVPVGPGGSVGSTCTLGAVSGSGYDAFLPVTCQFADVEVNAYTVQVTIDGGYYVGAGEDVVTVYDPSLGFATGGGWFYWPGTGDRTNFGFTMKYNKKVTKVQGNLLLIRHMPDGSIYRVKSNALEGLALGEDPSVPMGWASFSGKSTYQEPGWPEPQGNYEFVVYVEDWDEPGTGVDRFWIEVKDKSGAVVPAMSMDREATDNTVQLSGGNIAVPHGGGGKK